MIIDRPEISIKIFDRDRHFFPTGKVQIDVIVRIKRWFGSVKEHDFMVTLSKESVK